MASPTPIGPLHFMIFISSINTSPGRTICLNLALSIPAKYAVLPRFSGNDSIATAPVCASASMISTPGGNVNYKYVTYEGYGPNGIAIIVDALTDNINRTAANVRSAFTKGQGNIGTQGCVSFMFDKKGLIIVDKEECEMDSDDLMMTALDAGAEDFSEEEDCYEIYTDPDQWSEVDAALKEAGITPVSSEVTMIPQNWVELTDETAIKNLQKTLDLLDEDDDVQAVYHNWDE